mmetsp:Transcript_14551/g.24659  ORF Transcript_14551/g.24659 Transcript_14551/m.24659 type:complete len:312 (-) Transcript_14551:374-1309(-)
MVLVLRGLRGQVALALLRHNVDQHRPHRLGVPHLFEDGDEVVEVVAVHGADVVEPQLLEERAAAAADHAACVLVHLGGGGLQRLRQLLSQLLRSLPQLAQGARGLQAREGGGEAAHRVLLLLVVLRGQRHLLVVVEDHDHVGVHEARVVHGLVRHAAGDGAVTDHRNHVVVLPLQVAPHSHAQPCGDGGGAVASAEGVVLALRALGEGGQPVGHAQRLHVLPPPRQDLVRVRLVAHIPDHLVLREIEHAVQRDCELHHAQTGAEMAAGVAHIVDYVCAELLGHLFKLRQVEVLHVYGIVHSIQEWSGRLNI